MDQIKPKRGDIKRFREFLNSQKNVTTKHKHFRYQQLVRPYGDYLYAQDREKFNVDLNDWLNGKY